MSPKDQLTLLYALVALLCGAVLFVAGLTLKGYLGKASLFIGATMIFGAMVALQV